MPGYQRSPLVALQAHGVLRFYWRAILAGEGNQAATYFVVYVSKMFLSRSMAALAAFNGEGATRITRLTVGLLNDLIVLARMAIYADRLANIGTSSIDQCL